MGVACGPADAEDSPIETPSLLEPAMSKSPAHRLYAVALSALLTLCTLGAIDQLATRPQHDAAQWAQHATAKRV